MQNGLDRLPSLSSIVSELRRARVGLLAHPAAVDEKLVHVREVLRRLEINPVVIFGPEHGYGGEAQDMIGVGDARDRDGTPIVSLYGETFDALSPKPEQLAAIDLLVIDLQDIGTRFYTFVWTAVLAVRAAIAAGVRVIVLDRPNPIGDVVEGRFQDPSHRSFVGLEPLPIRHGLTLGEIVALRASVEGIERSAVTIVANAGIDRRARADSWNRPFVLPSPNMPTYETTLVYPGGCLLEGTNLSEGRGTTRPFETFGAPWIDGAALARDFDALGVPGVIARPIVFLPTFHKHVRKACGGIQIHVTNADQFRPVLSYVVLIALAHRQNPELFRFRTERYEYVDDIPAFDLLCGNAEARERIEHGDAPIDVARAISELREGERDVVAQARELLDDYRV